MNNLSKRNPLFITYGILTFFILFFFYAIVDTIAVFDTDDWLYIATLRTPFPMMHVWNPIKVFPEVFMPLVSYAGTYFIYPILGDFSYSLTLAHSIFISLILTVYFVEFTILIYKKITTSYAICFISGLVFFLLHFVALIHFSVNNETFFHARDLTCLYNYTASTAINGALVMHIISYGGIKSIKGLSFVHKFIILFWFYFSVFSNLYSSIVFAAYVSTDLFIDFYNDYLRKKISFRRLLLEHTAHIFFIGVWLLSHLIEKTGGRSGNRVHNLTSEFVKTFINLIKLPFSVNIFVIIFAIVVLVLGLKKHISNPERILKIIISFALTLLYVFLLCVVVDDWYITRPEVILAFGFWVLFSLTASFAELLSMDFKNWKIAIILCGSASMLIYGHAQMFRPINIANLNYEQCEAIMYDIISQFKVAEAEGLKEIDIIVPKFESEDNWPIATYANDRFPEALYRHHIISTKITVNKVVPSDEKSRIFLPESALSD